MDGILAASAHSSHAYRSGLNLYFTFALKKDDPKTMEAAYLEGWRRIMEAADAAGASLAHHHGVGRVRLPYLERELGTEGLDLLRRLKTALDPDGLLNPGALIPDA
jgi:alkyldihydroxyacetonephosphate synthase